VYDDVGAKQGVAVKILILRIVIVVLNTIWPVVRHIGGLRRWIVNTIINVYASSTPARPLPFSLWGPSKGQAGYSGDATADQTPASANYTSWTGLVDRRFTGRHLPEATATEMLSLPDLTLHNADFVALFKRKGEMTPCSRSTALFGFFAQWFTDSFLRTDPFDLRCNTSNHEIDLCQIYGLDANDTSTLRAKQGGRLKARLVDGLEFPELLFESDGVRVKEEFSGLRYIDPETRTFRDTRILSAPGIREKLPRYHAAGLERGNSTMFYSAINTVFLREHNRLARLIADDLGLTDDDEIFERARNTNIAQLIRIIISDYINHLSPTRFKLEAVVGFAETTSWYRTNRIAAEFDLLYRWHPLVPDHIRVGSELLAGDRVGGDNTLLETIGVAAVLTGAANQRAGKITLGNTIAMLALADMAALSKSRKWRIKPYNDYRKCFGLPPVKSFEELTGDSELAEQLAELYRGGIDTLDFFVGLFAEAGFAGGPLGLLTLMMVSVDAFSQALTNPLLSKNIYGPATFSPQALAQMEATTSFDDIVQRNVAMNGHKANFTWGQV
jgi:prostaglandin-endoperoxide synthase 2